tara:strand:- start:6973 stop:7935 length:963 start_codon:yes stop_codon:yes gene_type:complete
LEEQILRYYLKIFSIIIIFFFLFSSSLFFYSLNKNLNIEKNYINIEKGERIETILTNNIYNISKLDLLIFKLYSYTNFYVFKNFIHFGDFYVDKNISLINLYKTISKPSNVLSKITIVEGWSKSSLNNEIIKHFDNYFEISYESIISDTYFFEKNKDFKFLFNKLSNIRKKYFEKYQNNSLLDKFSFTEIMIIGSLIEKEGLDKMDKKKIASVIINRLEKNMKLQIDATVIFALTDGNYNLDRELLISDLQFDHPFNTYKHQGLPPKPISYVGKETLDIIFENHETDFLFYFFNKSLKKHIFSKNYENHKKKLNEYRNLK